MKAQTWITRDPNRLVVRGNRLKKIDIEVASLPREYKANTRGVGGSIRRSTRTTHLRASFARRQGRRGEARRCGDGAQPWRRRCWHGRRVDDGRRLPMTKLAILPLRFVERTNRLDASTAEVAFGRTRSQIEDRRRRSATRQRDRARCVVRATRARRRDKGGCRTP